MDDIVWSSQPNPDRRSICALHQPICILYPCSVLSKRHARRWLVPLACLAVGVAVAWWLLRDAAEPVHEGKPIGFWVDEYYRNWHEPYIDSADRTRRERAERAIRQIGSNAVPFAVKLARERPSRLKPKLLRILPFVTQQLRRRWNFQEWEKPFQSLLIFQIIGSDGKDAVPDLIQLTSTSDDYQTRRFAALSLGAIGYPARDALPALAQNLRHPADHFRADIVPALGGIWFDKVTGKQRPDCVRVVVPALTDLLKDPKADALRILQVLKDIGAEAQSAAPAIAPFLTHTDPGIRLAATNALERVSPPPITGPTRLVPPAP
jgi:hypothetical protein